MCDALWSDPSPLPGRTPSKRGVGLSFGKDVTHAFLDRNGLDLLVRSHEVKEEGYEVRAWRLGRSDWLGLGRIGWAGWELVVGAGGEVVVGPDG